jgi:uncharacterized protein (TIGR02145 family)
MKTRLLTFLMVFPLLTGAQKDVPAANTDMTEINTVQYQGKTYKTVKINDQLWMAQNLKARKFRNGDPIDQVNKPPVLTSNATICSDWTSEWSYAKLNSLPVWSFPNEDPKLGKKYGLLYNQHVIQDERKVCPRGWRIPTRDDWIQLFDFLEIEDYADDDDAIKLYKRVNQLDLTYGDSINDAPFMVRSGFDAVFSGVIGHIDASCQEWKRSGPGAYNLSDCDIYESGWWTSYSTQTDANGHKDIHYIYIRLIDAPSGNFEMQIFVDQHALITSGYGSGFPIRCVKN